MQSDFEPYFLSPEEAEEAFLIFDRNKNGNISRSEMRNTIYSIYRDRVYLQTSMRHSSSALKKLDLIAKSFMYIVLLFVCLSTLKFEIQQHLAAAISIWLGLSFAIGGTIKNVLESIIFLFFSHPYDVGDKIVVDEKVMFVKKFNLLTTVFKQDGKEVYSKIF